MNIIPQKEQRGLHTSIMGILPYGAELLGYSHENSISKFHVTVKIRKGKAQYYPIKRYPVRGRKQGSLGEKKIPW